MGIHDDVAEAKAGAKPSFRCESSLMIAENPKVIWKHAPHSFSQKDVRARAEMKDGDEPRSS